jgi:hypothetical protein
MHKARLALNIKALGLTGVMLLTCEAASAVEWQVSGFGSVIAGRTFGACTTTTAMAERFSDDCTRYIADWSHASVYENRWTVAPESRLGVQVNAKFTDSLSGVVQLMGRSAPGQAVGLEWAYLSHDFAPGWTLQVGRKRLPLYYYSDFQDVGYAHNTIRTSPDVYGWDVVNYNGANLQRLDKWGEWSVRQDLFAGAENSKNNAYNKLFSNDLQRVSWSNILGGSVEVNKGWFTARLTYVQSDFEQKDQATGERVEQPSGAFKGKQRFYGIAVNGDWDDWILRSELASADRSDYAYKANFHLVSLSYRMGSLITTVGVSAYGESTPFPDAYNTTAFRTSTVALRYDLTGKSAVKIQFDKLKDKGNSRFTGDARVLSLSYDFVF